MYVTSTPRKLQDGNRFLEVSGMAYMFPEKYHFVETQHTISIKNEGIKTIFLTIGTDTYSVEGGGVKTVTRDIKEFIVSASEPTPFEVQSWSTANESSGGGAGLTTYATLAALQSALPNGASYPVWVTSEKSWYYWDGVAPPTDTTAPTVTASPSGGTYTSVQSVTLSANETSTIYYTTDGSTPTTSSTPYSSPIVISVNTTLKFFARDTAGNDSAVQTVTYTINIAEPDTTPPNEATGLAATPGTTTVDLTWVGSNSSDIQGYNVYDGAMKKNGALITGMSYTVTGLTPETPYTFTVKAVDTSSNESTGVQVTTATTAAAGGDGPYRLNLNGSDTGIKLPVGATINAVELEVNIFNLNTGGAANNGYLVDLRNSVAGLPNGYVFNGGIGTGIAEFYINGVAGIDKATHWAEIPKGTKNTLKYVGSPTITTGSTGEYTLFKRSNTVEGWLRVDVYKIRLYNGATLVAEYDFTNQFAGTQVTDQTGNGRHATILGTGYSWVTG